MVMMAARSFSKTLIRVSSSSYPFRLFTPKSSSPTLLNCRRDPPQPYYRLIARRHQSSSHDNPSQVLVLDVDLNHADSDAQALAVQKIEDAIHRIIVRRSTPDWLPFLPGSSFWVPPPPPPRRHGIAQFVHNLANPLSDEEAMSLATLRGWPSSSFYLHHDPSSELAEFEVEMSSTKLSPAEDEEGWNKV